MSYICLSTIVAATQMFLGQVVLEKYRKSGNLHCQTYFVTGCIKKKNDELFLTA